MSTTTSAQVEIPLVVGPQQFTTTLAGVSYGMNIYWNMPGQQYCLDLLDANNNPLIMGMPMVPGPDLLAQYAYLAIGGSLYVVNTVSPDNPPSYNDLGTVGLLIFVPAA